MPATVLKNKVMYRQFIDSVVFCKLTMLYMFKIFVSLLSGHASYLCDTWYRITSTKSRINTVVSPDDRHIVARNM
jgi:hypothetical protein